MGTIIDLALADRDRNACKSNHGDRSRSTELIPS
jgi:hypothetical protein